MIIQFKKHLRLTVISLKKEGIARTLIKIQRQMFRQSPRLGNLLRGVLVFCFGKEKALGMTLSFFKFRCKYGFFLFPQNKCLWLGKILSDYVLKVIYVDPAEIKHTIQEGFVPYVQSGDWDLKKRDFVPHSFITEFYEQNLPLKGTTQYKSMYRDIQAKNWKKTYWCRSLKDLDKYFEILVRAMEEIRNDNYLTQEELDEKNPKAYYPGEILVSMDRDGNYLHETAGWHRLSMAKYCNLKKVPIVVIRKHLDFVQRNNQWNILI